LKDWKNEKKQVFPAGIQEVIYISILWPELTCAVKLKK